MNPKFIRISPFTALLLAVNLVSLVAIAMLSAEVYSPARALIVGILLSAVVCWGFRFRVNLRLLFPGAGFFVLLLLGILFRFAPYEHFYGGQDQGLYTNFSELLLENEGVTFEDEFRNGMNDRLLDWYDRFHTPGIVRLEDSTRAVAFYPLHPVWMSISRTFLGEDRNSWSNLLFSFIGVFSLYCASVLVFRSRYSGVIVALLLVMNPALSFFAKFPVAETPAIAFSSSGFLYLLASLRCRNRRKSILYYCIALASFGSFCFVKMQFLFYIPFFCVLLCSWFVFGDRRLGRSVSVFAFLVFCLFGVSMLFYEKLQPYLFYGVFRDHVGTLLSDLLANPVEALVVVALAIVSGSWLIYSQVFKGGDFFQKGGARLMPYAAWLMPLCLVLSIPSLASIVLNGEMVPFGFFADKGDLSALRFHSLYRLMLMVGPFAFLSLMFLPVFKLRLSPALVLLMVFIFSNWLVTLSQPWVPYLYYYGRYLSADILPYAIVVVGGVFAEGIRRGKLWSRVGLGLTVAYFAFFSYVQIGNPETEDGEVLDSFVEMVAEDDIVVLSDVDVKLATRLKFREGLKTFEIGSVVNGGSRGFATLTELVSLQSIRGGTLFFVCRSRVPGFNYPQYRGKLESVYRYLSNGEHSRIGVGRDMTEENLTGVSWGHFLLPFYSAKKREEYFVYELDASSIARMSKQTPWDVVMFSNEGYPTQLAIEGFDGPEELGAWTNQKAATIRFETDETVPYSRFVLVGHAYATKNYSQGVRFFVNGELVLERVFAEGENSFEIEFSFDPLAADELLIGFEFPTLTSPKEQGEGGDPRSLGLYLREIRFL